ncbi:division/cell wall cluster transcriptional repressor MraZ [Marinifilum sp. D714]|uniref:division/cell wall cluster transcriptional repressor MraZ n=1 Tax=Marinifilum sp. D714 TaxID=2937523 RepID=UPI0027C959CD|nr:division/cell wall cluster transcriptional repressor MraZ [Marinifilum sp. D714]MDQ2180354.1 division/cell wall cluster transcriptional repressor MraZ [Marinifilum sp. D714]
MQTFIGDYQCKLDAKGRVLLPSAFRKLLNGDSENRCVLRKNLHDRCLDLYPMKEWERQIEMVRARVNTFNKRHAAFMREFYRGTAEVQIDSNGRILIPKKFFEFAGFRKEITLAGQDDKIEIWDTEAYEKPALSDDDFSSLANEILGGSINPEL